MVQQPVATAIRPGRRETRQPRRGACRDLDWPYGFAGIDRPDDPVPEGVVDRPQRIDLSQCGPRKQDRAMRGWGGEASGKRRRVQLPGCAVRVDAEQVRVLDVENRRRFGARAVGGQLPGDSVDLSVELLAGGIE